MSDEHAATDPSPAERREARKTWGARLSGFLWRTKKFWMPPLLLALFLLALLYYAAGKSNVIAPFVYGP